MFIDILQIRVLYECHQHYPLIITDQLSQVLIQKIQHHQLYMRINFIYHIIYHHVPLDP